MGHLVGTEGSWIALAEVAANLLVATGRRPERAELRRLLAVLRGPETAREAAGRAAAVARVLAEIRAPGPAA